MTPKGNRKQAARGKTAEGSETQYRALGEMLQRAREDLGMDYAQLAEITMLRPPILKSLENEEWERLAAPVFIKGFLRSYARALKLPEQEILRLYGEREPNASAVPKPLASLIPHRKKTPVVVFIFLILLVGLAFFAWHRYDLFRRAQESLLAGEGLKGEMATPARDSEPHAPPLVKQTDGNAKTGVVPGVTGIRPEERLPDVAMSKMPTAPARKGTPGIPDKKTSNEQTQSAVAQPRKKEEPLGIKGATEVASKAFTLEAEVRETTWVRIFVDHDAPKEYVFRPGSHPEWKANEGFKIIIGNAAGIALVFNGRKLDNLGQHGKVISLRLPENMERTLSD
ncbi:MAG: RodZ domain-containing protein [Desulfatiglandaceae bacterium]|jgi:cytoskeleton protein RodZ